MRDAVQERATNQPQVLHASTAEYTDKTCLTLQGARMLEELAAKTGRSTTRGPHKAITDEGCSSGLKAAALKVKSHGLTAATPMENPYCGCELTRVRAP